LHLFVHEKEKASGEGKVAVKELKAKVSVAYILWATSPLCDMYIWGRLL